MKVRVLRSAIEDLAAGRRFYDAQADGVGAYFFDSIFSEIDSLVLFGGIHRMQFGFHRLLAKRFHTPSITVKSPVRFWYSCDRPS